MLPRRLVTPADAAQQKEPSGCEPRGVELSPDELQQYADLVKSFEKPDDEEAESVPAALRRASAG